MIDLYSFFIGATAYFVLMVIVEFANSLLESRREKANKMLREYNRLQSMLDPRGRF